MRGSARIVTILYPPPPPKSFVTLRLGRPGETSAAASDAPRGVRFSLCRKTKECMEKPTLRNPDSSLPVSTGQGERQRNQQASDLVETGVFPCGRGKRGRRGLALQQPEGSSPGPLPDGG